jgi:hypothetical protein
MTEKMTSAMMVTAMSSCAEDEQHEQKDQDHGHQQ